MIRFTVITCTYMAGNVVQRTLDSVLHQRYDDVEHIIVDGASTDCTMQIAEQYINNSARYAPKHLVKVVSEDDKGLYDAMNKGIDMATGDYIVFLNAGDKFHSDDTLENIAISIGDGEEMPGVLYGDTNIVDGDGIFLHQRRLRPPKNLSWKSFKYGMLVCHQAFYARTSLAKVTAYDLSLRYSADVDWCIRIMKLAEKDHLPLHNVNAVVADYLEGGMSVQNHRASLMERFSIMRRHYGFATTLLMHLWFVIRAVIKRQ